MFVRIIVISALFSQATFANNTLLTRADLARISWLTEHSDNALVRSSLSEEKAFREATKFEIEWYLQHIKNTRLKSEQSIADIYARVLTRMQADLESITRFNQEFAKLSVAAGEITWSCQTNKLALIVPEAISLFEQYGFDLLLGTLPSEFEGYWDQPRCQGVCEGRMGDHNSRELALKASLLLTTLEIAKRSHLSAHCALDGSPTIHSTPLPKNLILPDIQKLSFFYNGTFSPVQGELAFVHGGYAFGGQRDDTPYKRFGPYGKPFGPQDCSSWITKIIQLPPTLSTGDFADYHQIWMGHDEAHCSAISSEATQDFFQRLIPIEVNSIDQVKPGMVLVTRRGSSGHAALIIDIDPGDFSLMTLDYNRNLPLMEGFGVRRIPFAAPANTKQYFFQRSSGNL